MGTQTVTNKMMADHLGVPLSRVRRWSKEFLPPDPRATRQSGYIRELSLNDAWFVYISGTIMTTLGLTFRRTAEIMDAVVKPWLLKVGLVPDFPQSFRLHGIDRELTLEYELHFRVSSYERQGSHMPIIMVHGFTNGLHEDKFDSTGLEYQRVLQDRIVYKISESNEAHFAPAHVKDFSTLYVISFNRKVQWFLSSLLEGDEWQHWSNRWWRLHDDAQGAIESYNKATKKGRK